MIAIERCSAASSGIGSDAAGSPMSDCSRVIAKVVSSAQEAAAVLLASW